MAERNYYTGVEMEAATRPWKEAIRKVAIAESLPEDARYRDLRYEQVFTEAVTIAVAMAFADDVVDWEYQYHHDAEFHHRTKQAAQWVALLHDPGATLRRLEKPDRTEVLKTIMSMPPLLGDRTEWPLPGTVESDGT